jgi:STE24 endopeptidase
MASEELILDTAPSSLPSSDKAKTYNRIKLITGLISWVLSFALLVALVASGVTRQVEDSIRETVTNDYAVLLLFTLVIGLFQTAITLPAGFFSGYIIERRFQLSNQTVGRWAWERGKGLLVSLPLLTGLVVLVYYCLDAYRALWWLPVSVVISVFSVILARLAPVLIMPLFYRFTPLPEGSLRQRIEQLCIHAKIRFEGIFSFNLSKNTKKANAGFTGIGKSRRIVLGDTLISDFTDEEIETVFAHELGHYVHRHIAVGIAVGTFSTFAGLFVTSLLYDWSRAYFSFTSAADIAALPLLAVWLSLIGLVGGPLGNIISRRHEHQADAYAVRTTGNKAAFLSALRKLSTMNLADPEPHPLVEFLFYSHPSIGKRLRSVEMMRV